MKERERKLLVDFFALSQRSTFGQIQISMRYSAPQSYLTRQFEYYNDYWKRKSEFLR